jgi:hypothetical protein
MTRSFHALERSLREGSPDEAGYRADPLRLDGTVRADDPAADLIVRRARLGGAGRGRSLQVLVPTSYLAAMLAVAIGLGGLAILGRYAGTGGGETSPPSSPSAVGPPGSGLLPVPSLGETFISARHGFSVRYPAGWTVRAATTSWPQDIFLPPGNQAWDDLQRPGEARLEIASQRLRSGQTEADWLAAQAPFYPGPKPCKTLAADSPRIAIGQQSGYLTAAACPEPADSTFSSPDLRYTAIVFAGGRIYQIDLDGRVDRAYFQAIVDTIRLDPASAVDG